jgi:hypothetical protein
MESRWCDLSEIVSQPISISICLYVESLCRQRHCVSHATNSVRGDFACRVRQAKSGVGELLLLSGALASTQEAHVAHEMNGASTFQTSPLPLLVSVTSTGPHLVWQGASTRTAMSQSLFPRGRYGKQEEMNS